MHNGDHKKSDLSQIPIKSANKQALLRSLLLFTNFFLIITALYHIKPASRSLILESHGVEALPYVWIGSALVLVIVISFYQRLLSLLGRIHMVRFTVVVFSGLLILFWFLLKEPNGPATISFYIFVDIFGVVLVEQFWSLTNSLYSTTEGKRWYGLVGTGGLLGGLIGGTAAAMTIKFTSLETPDLLLVAGAILVLIYLLTGSMQRLNIYQQDSATTEEVTDYKEGWALLTRSRYLLMIAGLLLLSQIASPLVEYQFMGIIEENYPEREARTAMLSIVFSILSAVSIGVNLLITPLILRHMGVLGGLLVQPVVMAIMASGFLFSPTLAPAMGMKISDRGFSYSINRASKELLYVPIDMITMYKAKAWIDMFGYRLFKVGGSMIILLLTQWTLIASYAIPLTWVILIICLFWMMLLRQLHQEYQLVTVTE